MLQEIYGPKVTKYLDLFITFKKKKAKAKEKGKINQ